MQLFQRVVQSVAAKDLKKYAEDGWTVLDVRPTKEADKVHLCEAVEVPMFRPDTSIDPFSLVKRWSAFGAMLLQSAQVAQEYCYNINVSGSSF